MTFAVIQKGTELHEDVLVGVFLMKYDADIFTKSQIKPEWYEVKEFKMNWEHWIEYRKTLGIY